MKILNPEKAFHLKLKILYGIEKELEKALPKMVDSATDPELKKGFKEHLMETKRQSKRLEEIFTMMGQKPQKNTQEGIKGILLDGNEIMKSDTPEDLKNALLAGAGRDVEHYEMACYLNAILEAKALGMDDAVSLLEETLNEEIMAEEKLALAMEANLEKAGQEAREE